MRKLRIPLVDIVSSLSIASVGLILLFGLLSFHLTKLLGGILPSEVASLTTVKLQTLHIKDILTQDSLFLPYQVGLYLLEKLHLSSVTAVRQLSVICGVLGTVGFYFVIRSWHTRRVSLMTTFLFATSSLFLYTARLASPAAMYLLMPWLIYFGIRLQQNNLRLLGLGGIFAGTILMLYVPGLVWFIAPAIIWQRHTIRKEIRQLTKFQGLLVLLGSALLIAPLLISLGTQLSLVKEWLGWPAGGISPFDFIKHLVGVPLQLFVRSDLDPSSHVGRLPYLDIATTALVALGAYWYFFLRKLDRTKLLVGGLVGGAALAALNIQALPILLPFIYLVVGAGITLLLQQWFTVFPRNPLARSVGVGLIVILLGLTGYYNMHRYFVAWPHTPETRQAYSSRI